MIDYQKYILNRVLEEGGCSRIEKRKLLKSNGCQELLYP